jgi:hypothetical protein
VDAGGGAVGESALGGDGFEGAIGIGFEGAIGIGFEGAIGIGEALLWSGGDPRAVKRLAHARLLLNR